jgi:hypothetical protein
MVGPPFRSSPMGNHGGGGGMAVLFFGGVPIANTSCKNGPGVPIFLRADGLEGRRG